MQKTIDTASQSLFITTFKRKAVLVTVTITVCVILVLTFYDILMPDLGWDALMYHLFIPASWIQNGSIYVPEASPYGNLKYWMYYPSNAELMYAFSLLLTGDDIIVELNQLLHAIFISLTIYAFLRNFGVKRSFAIFSFPIVFSIPVVFLQSITSYNDLIFSAYLLYSFYILYNAVKEPNKKAYYVLLGISLGLFLGIKYTSPGFTIIILLITLITGRPLSKKYLLISSLIGILLGGYWYFRNAFLTGNPFYPYSLHLGNVEILRGPINPSRYRWLFEYKVKPLHWILLPLLEQRYAHDYAGFGPLIVYSFPFYCQIIFHVKKLMKIDKYFTLFFLMIPLYNMLIWIMQPFKFTRFLIPALCVVAVSPLIATSHKLMLYNGRDKNLEVLFLSLIVTIALLTNTSYLIYKTHPVEFNFAVNYLLGEHGIPSKYSILELGGYGEEGKAWAYVGRTIRNSTIAYTNTNLPYYLFGEKLTNKVIYVDPQGDVDLYIKKLRENHVDYIFIVKRKGDAWPNERNFILENMEMFELRYVNNVVELYSFKGDLSI